MQRQLAQAQAEAVAMQQKLADVQSIDKAWQGLNAEMQALALFNAQLLSARDAAVQLGVHESTVRRKARQLNGMS